MKKIFLKSLSTLIALLMIFSSSVALISAEDDVDAPQFAVNKIEETPTTLILEFALTGGKLAFIDGSVTVTGLTCTAAYTSDELDAFTRQLKVNGDQFIGVANRDNGKFSASGTTNITEALGLFVFEFEKTEATGIDGTRISVNIESCGVTIGGNDTDMTEQAAFVVNVSDTHVHENLTWTTVTEPSCDAEGLKTAICSACGETVSETIAKTEHASTHTVTEEATCHKKGSIKTVCDRCGEVLSTEIIPATNHPNRRVERQEATCTEDGVRRVYCEDCGALLLETVIPATNHAKTYTEQLDATCTTDGYVRTYCKYCKELLSEEILPAKGHGESITETTPATCTEAGSIVVKCAVCDQVISSQTIPAKGHGENITETTPATCTEAGSIVVKCADCDQVISSQTIPAKGHGELTLEKKDKTCTDDGYIRYRCNDCHNVVTENILRCEGHKNVDYTIDSTCTEIGHEMSECSVCHHVSKDNIIPAKGHKWTSWSTVKEPTYRSVGISRRNCTRCDAYEDKEIPMIKYPVSSVKISMESLAMGYKKTNRLYADVMPEEAAFSANIIWTSSDPSIVSVDEDGTITSHRIGTAVITASTEDGKFSDSCTVTVKYTWLQWIIVYILFGWIWYV